VAGFKFTQEKRILRHQSVGSFALSAQTYLEGTLEISAPRNPTPESLIEGPSHMDISSSVYSATVGGGGRRIKKVESP
jgi:hypothetical protein